MRAYARRHDGDSSVLLLVRGNGFDVPELVDVPDEHDTALAQVSLA